MEKTNIWKEDYDVMDFVESYADEIRSGNIEPTTSLKEYADDVNGALYEEAVNAFDIPTNKIVVFAKLGLWSGINEAAVVLKEQRLKAIFNVCHYQNREWFTKNNEVRATESHHDGTNEFMFRELKDDVSEEEFWDEYKKDKQRAIRYCTESLCQKVEKILEYGK